MSLFRKKALAKMSSPERLDELFRVTSPLGWLALLTVGVLLIGVVVWSILGTIPTRISGTGILAAGDYFYIQAPENGRLVDLTPKMGQLVRPGDYLAEISQPSIEDQREQTRREYEARRDSHRRARNNLASDERAWNDEIERSRGQIVDIDAQIAELESKIGGGTIAVNRLRDQIRQLEVRRDQTENSISRVRERARAARQHVEDLRSQMAVALTRYESADDRAGRSERVTAEVGGEVVGVEVKSGANVTAGQPLVRLLSRYDEGFEARFYVSSRDGAVIDLDDDVEVSPASVKKEEYGFLRGKVVDISRVTVTLAQLKDELGGDQTRAQEILKSMGAVYRVRASLTEWSSRKDPPGELGDSENIQVNVITEERAPITMVIPKFKKMLGLS